MKLLFRYCVIFRPKKGKSFYGRPLIMSEAPFGVRRNFFAWTYCLNDVKFSKLILSKIVEFVAMHAYVKEKSDFGWGSALPLDLIGLLLRERGGKEGMRGNGDCSLPFLIITTLSYTFLPLNAFCQQSTSMTLFAITRDVFPTPMGITNWNLGNPYTSFQRI